METLTANTLPQIAYLGIGSNLQDRLDNLQRASRALAQHPCIQLLTESRVWESAPAYVVEQPDFLNMCVEISTTLSPEDLLEEILRIEGRMGRVRSIDKGPRLIDIDILFFGAHVINSPALQVPHPCMRERSFVMLPLCEICPNFIHPVLGQSVESLAQPYLHTSDCRLLTSLTEVPGTTI